MRLARARYSQTKELRHLSDQVAAGELTIGGLRRLVELLWAPPEDATWDEHNGVVPYSYSRVVRRSGFDIGDNLVHDPSVVGRWMLSGEDPTLLVEALGVHMGDNALVAFMDGSQTYRTSFRFLVALAGDAVEVAASRTAAARTLQNMLRM